MVTGQERCVLGIFFRFCPCIGATSLTIPHSLRQLSEHRLMGASLLSFFELYSSISQDSSSCHRCLCNLGSCVYAPKPLCATPRTERWAPDCVSWSQAWRLTLAVNHSASASTPTYWSGRSTAGYTRNEDLCGRASGIRTLKYGPLRSLRWTSELSKSISIWLGLDYECVLYTQT